MRTLLVPVFGDRSDRLGLSTATALARHFGMHIEVLYARDDPIPILPSNAPGQIGLAFTPNLFDLLDKQEEARLRRARRHFKDFCEQEKVPVAGSPPGPDGASARWHEIAGNDVDLVLALGRFRDLVVIADAPLTDRLVPAGAGVLLLGGRPVLLTGSGTLPTVGRRIAIAWKNTPEAARAVWAAMPLL